ncbi:MAG: LysR family transcriptional regulator [Candidatus Velthaea sp.]
MELRQLFTFQAVAKSRSFTQAAERLSYSQSNVTAHIQALEEELQTRLFERLGKHVELTAAGRRLVTYADRLLALAEEASHEVPEPDVPSGVLTIGACETLCAYLIPSILTDFRREFPSVRLVIHGDHCPDLPNRLLGGDLDVALTLTEPLHLTAFAIEDLAREPLMVVVRCDHRLAQQASVALTAFRDEPFIVYQEGNATWKALDEAFGRPGMRAHTTLQFNSDEAIKQCVLAGLGVGVVPHMVVERELAEGSLVAINVADLEITLATQMLWHKDKWISPALRAFADVTRRSMRSRLAATNVAASLTNA